MDAPQFIDIENQRLSIKEAQNILDEVLHIVGIKLPAANKSQHEILIHHTGEKIKYFELQNHTRQHGVCGPIQFIIDRTDPVFKATFGISSPNWQFPQTVEYAGYTKSLAGPFRSYPVEMEIANDIEFYREETCIESAQHDFEMCFRNYRGFLLSCISLIDAYINSHILIHDFNKITSADFTSLKECFNTERRIELFLKVFANADITAVNQTEEWDNFKKIKEARNEMVHATVPFLGISIKDLAANLNNSKKGVGGLLRLFQKLQGKHSLGFIEQIRTAPSVYYNKINQKSDGTYEVHRVY